MTENDPIDVLICGAGAAGLTLALDLARRGVSFRLIEKSGTPFVGSRGKGIQPRTQEVFEDLGILDAIAAMGSPYPPHRNHRQDGGYEEVQDVVIEAPTAQEPYRSMLLVPQFVTEGVMRSRLAGLGAAPEFGHELVAFEEHGDGVTASVESPKGRHRQRCRYLVGADGGRSFVRSALGVDFPGQTLGVRAIVADLELDGLARDAWHWFNRGEMAQQISFCPLPRSGLFQLQAPIRAEGEPDLSVAGLQAFVDSRVPAGSVSVRAVPWASAYTMNARLADRYRAGRVLLVGDAAHVHPPTGAQGLNTSVQDAYNLGWKLSAVLAGAPEALLDTYEEERRPIAAGMLGLASEMLDRARRGNLRRDREVAQLDLDYAWSSLSLPIDDDGRLHAGARAPDVRLRGAGGQPRRLFDLTRGTHWTWIVHGRPVATLPPERRGLRVHHVAAEGEYADEDGAMATVYGLRDGDHLLIRPDGYVAAIVDRDGGGKVFDHLASALPSR
ncbi:FAD-dependent oxidoreductase [Sphingomonas corticis]|uniref:FAD-dependent oxidoreductase n=1 Tax=Sphingomonas corticis TaxID=2722791 RepID=A0ABX1CUQ8_9SPHN|nr:FAD-dependent oxidoreductase [Sphingomonas corticis]NJR80035.1 FAD-dependent oxidoreductase [Sphingomonas corticis]